MADAALVRTCVLNNLTLHCPLLKWCIGGEWHDISLISEARTGVFDSCGLNCPLLLTGQEHDLRTEKQGGSSSGGRLSRSGVSKVSGTISA